MNVKIDNYVFDKTAKTITFSDYLKIDLNRVVLITNVNTNTMIYNFAGSGKGGTVSGNILTLDYDTSAMANTDELQIIYDDKNESILASLLQNVVVLLRNMANPAWVDKSANQMRAQITGSLTTAGTVSTVTTVTGITNFGGYPAQQMVIDQNRASWAVLARGRLS